MVLWYRSISLLGGRFLSLLIFFSLSLASVTTTLVTGLVLFVPGFGSKVYAPASPNALESSVPKTLLSD